MHNELPSYEQAPAGAIRFNTDSRKLEVYTGGPVGYGTLPNGQWMQVDSFTPDIATGGARGVFGGGRDNPTYYNTIEYINISSTGNAIDFGDISERVNGFSAVSSKTRGVFSLGTSPSLSFFNTIEYITIASTGDSIDFGDLSNYVASPDNASNSTRGIWAGGSNPSGYLNTIEYITIASKGDAIDFGDYTQTINSRTGSSNTTRGIFAGGRTAPTVPVNIIDFITFSTLGNSSDFGDILISRWSSAQGSCSNSIRGLIAGGTSPTVRSTIEYVNIASTGDGIDFGDLSGIRRSLGSASSSTRCTFAGGTSVTSTGTNKNTIEYVTIMSTGNAIDFGDLSAARRNSNGLSNGHGGL